MKKSNLLSKGIVLVIIILFIGVSISPTTGNKAVKKRNLKDSPAQDIDGLYYLRGVDPLNMNDDGTYSLITDASRCLGLEEEKTKKISEWLESQIIAL